MEESSKEWNVNQPLAEDEAQTSDSEEEGDEELEELSKIDYVEEWLQKHCFFDEQAWSAVMMGVEATPNVQEYECLEKPDPPCSNFVLDGGEYTSL